MLSRTAETMVIVLAVIMLAGTLTLLIVSAIHDVLFYYSS